MLHKWDITKTDKLPCPICNRCFRKNSLRCHLRLHTDERIFKCNECMQSFTRKSNLKEHIQRIHLKQLTEKQSKSKNGQELSFGCSICEKQFKRK